MLKGETVLQILGVPHFEIFDTGKTSLHQQFPTKFASIISISRIFSHPSDQGA